MKQMDALQKLEQYVNMPSGSADLEGLAAFVSVVEKDMQALGMTVAAEDTGGAGDVAFAAMEGLAALDGFGLLGENAHTTKECGSLVSFERNVKLSAAVMRALFANPDLVK